MSESPVTGHFEPPGYARMRLPVLLRQHQVDALLLTSPENVFYTTGFPALTSSGNPILFALRNVLPFFAYVASDGRTTLFCWGGAVTGVRYGVDEIVSYPDLATGLRLLGEYLKAHVKTGESLGLESSCPLRIYTLVSEIVTPAQVKDADPILIACRTIKSPHEVEALARSTQIVERAVEDLMDVIHLGISRPWLMQVARKRLMAHGATGIDHITISFGASNPEVEIEEELLPNKLVTLDLGAIYQGYVSDNRRLMYTGVVPEGMRDLHETMCAIVDEVADTLAPEMTFGQIYQAAMALYDHHDLKPFIPNIGHTIGLQVEEVWFDRPDDPTPLREGMVLNLEMYALYETGELIGDEETYVITANGARRLTTLPRAIKAVN